MALRSLEATMKENAAKHGMPPWLLRAVEPSFGAAETGAGDRGERLGRVKLSVGYEGDMGLTVPPPSASAGEAARSVAATTAPGERARRM